MAFIRRTIALTAGDVPKCAALADLYGTGHKDLIIACATSKKLKVYKNDGRGFFTLVATYGTSGNPIAVAAGNIFGNGRQDVAVFCTSAPTFCVVEVWKNNDLGILGLDRAYRANSAEDPPAGQLALGDLAGRGVVDMVYLTQTQDDGNVSVRPNEGNGRYSAEQSYELAAATQHWGFRLGDVFNNDGTLDIVAHQGDEKIRYRENDGSGDFSLIGGGQLAGAYPGFGKIGLFNFSGTGLHKLDVASVNLSTLSIGLFNVGTGIHDTPSTVDTGTGGVAAPSWLEPCEFSLATRGVLIAYSTLDLVKVMGYGAPWTVLDTITVGDVPVHIAVGDLNGDGFDDAVVCESTGNTLSVLINDGSW